MMKLGAEFFAAGYSVNYSTWCSLQSSKTLGFLQFGPGGVRRDLQNIDITRATVQLQNGKYAVCISIWMHILVWRRLGVAPKLVADKLQQFWRAGTIRLQSLDFLLFVSRCTSAEKQLMCHHGPAEIGGIVVDAIMG